MSDRQTVPVLELKHTAMSEEEALRFLDGHRISRGGRTMDPKAQIVGEFIKSIRVPGYYPPLPELRQQLRTMVGLMDEPAPALSRIEDIDIPGPAGAIGARVYDPAAASTSLRPVVAYFHGGGWVQATWKRIMDSARGSPCAPAPSWSPSTIAWPRNTSSPPPSRTAWLATAGSALTRASLAATRPASDWPATLRGATSPRSSRSYPPAPASPSPPARP